MLPLFLGLLSLVSASIHPGLRTSLHESSLQDFISSFVPSYLSQVLTTGLGPISFPLSLLVATVTVNVTHTQFAELQVASTTLEMDPANQTIWLKIRGLDMDFESSFLYHTKISGWTEGKFYLYMEGASLTIPLSVGIDEEGKLDCKISTIEESFLDMEYQFNTDSYLMDILSFLGSIPPFNYVDTLITNLLFAKSISEFGTKMNKVLQSMAYTAEIGPMMVDYHFSEFNITEDLYLEAAINGTVYPKNSNVSVPYAAPEAGEWLSDEQFRMQISQYTMDTFAWAAYLSGFMQVNVTPSMVPASVPFSLSTSGLAMVFPGLVKKYGPNKAVEFQCQASKQPSITVSAMLDIALYGQCNAMVQVNKTSKQLAFTLLFEVDTVANFTLYSSSKASYLIGGLNTTATNLTQLSYTASNIGPINVSTLQLALSSLVKLAAAVATTQYLSQGIALPIPAGVMLNNTKSLTSTETIELAAQTSFHYLIDYLLRQDLF